jgi:hypothetical protein
LQRWFQREAEDPTSDDQARPDVVPGHHARAGDDLGVMLTILFDGIAYGVLLFVLALGPGRDDRA